MCPGHWRDLPRLRGRDNPSLDSIDAGEVLQAVQRVAKAALESRPDAAGGLPAGVRLLDSWWGRRDGAVVFWIDRSLNLHGQGQALLHHEQFERHQHDWQPAGAGSGSCESPQVLIARLGRGLHRLGGGGRDPLRLTTAIASGEVATIELRSDHGSTIRRPGADGFCLFGITFSDPITYAHPLDAAQRSLGEPLLL